MVDGGERYATEPLAEEGRLASAPFRQFGLVLGRLAVPGDVEETGRGPCRGHEALSAGRVDAGVDGVLPTVGSGSRVRVMSGPGCSLRGRGSGSRRAECPACRVCGLWDSAAP